ncbi:MAG: hypothetical protein JKY56_24090, partial [Kofleriaceae bacterium]|nr:hypothetical protein [Kofleriaceae bacterium]
MNSPVPNSLRSTSLFRTSLLVAGLMLSSAHLLACGPKAGQYISGTQVSSSDENRAVIDRVEEYRIAIEEKNTNALMLMASREYREDGGTPAGDDDYGFSGLRELLKTRFAQAVDIRYSIRYMRVRYIDESEMAARKTFVDVIVDASFTIPDARGGVIR